MLEKYEREIEEIVRNLEHRERKASSGPKRSGRLRRKASVRRNKPTFHLTLSEWCLTIACVAALGAGGWADAHGSGDLITGIIGLIGAVCLAFVALSSSVVKLRYSSSTRREKT